jgi:hypothetical protein
LQEFMSALLPKADMCSAEANVRFGPIADMAKAERPPGGGLSKNAFRCTYASQPGHSDRPVQDPRVKLA